MGFIGLEGMHERTRQALLHFENHFQHTFISDALILISQEG